MARQSRVVREVAKGSVFDDAKPVVSSAVSWDQGDLLYFDNSADLIKPVSADADCATFLGIADVTCVSGKIPSPYQGTAVDAAQAIESIPGPIYGVEAKMKLKQGDSFNPGDLIYGTAVDAQTVSSSGTKAIGVYVDEAVASAPSGTQGIVRLGHRFPADTLVI